MVYFTERLDQILEILRQKKKVDVHYLAKKLFVSEPTIRRDLKILEEEGKIKRSYGGAVLGEFVNTEIPLVLRETERVAEKELIASKAKDYISDGDVLFLDASSTTLALVKHLSSFTNLTVVTNSPKTSLKLAEMQIRSFCTGGLLLENSIAYVGPLAERFVANFNADVFFFSCRGVSNDGVLSDSSIDESEIRKVMMAHAKKKIFLCTSDKVGKEYMYKLTDLSQVDQIICDKDLPELSEKLKK